MDPKQEITDLGKLADETESDGSVSVDDFIKQLEEKEKDLHITANTTIIEIAESFDDANLPDFLKEDLQIEAAKKVAVAEPVTATPNAANDSSASLEREIVGLKEQITQINAERDELLKTTLRRAKDFENFRSRTERERRETFQNQVGNLATQMLPALDNLNRAVDFALTIPEERRTEFQQFFEGIVLVNQQMNEVFAEMGVQPIPAVGETFDPNLHEAVATEESDEFDPNTISVELLRGYRIGDRVIRHSMVKVAKGTAPEITPVPAEHIEEETPDHLPDNVDSDEQ